MSGIEEGNLIVKEKEERSKVIDRIKETEGFKLLTARQRKIIILSLYIQQRAQRNPVPIYGGRNQISGFEAPRGIKCEPEGGCYQESQSHISEHYCHSVICNLEQGETIPALPVRPPREFFQADYKGVQNKDELIKIVEQCGFPCVVFIDGFAQIPRRSDAPSPYHSFLALGHVQNGDILTWEKLRVGCPYRVTTLDEIYTYQSSSLFWGVRRLIIK